MSATGEVETVTAEKPVMDVPSTEQKPSQPEEKVTKGKKAKAKAPKEKKPKTASHPPYFEMIKEALMALKEKSGSSPHAIAKYMEEKHKSVLPANFKKILGLQLKNSASKGKLIKIKASYKLSESGKKANAATTKPPAVKKAAPAKATTDASLKKKKASVKAGSKRKAEEPVAKKKVAAAAKVMKKAKKVTPAKAKQPRSIKSPAGKKAKKA